MPRPHLYLLLGLLAAYGVWRLRRISFDLLVAVTGLSFFLVVLTTPAPPGWYLWLVPFLVAHQLQGDRSAMLLTGLLSLLLIAMHLLISPGAGIPAFGWHPQPAIANLAATIDPKIMSLWMTMVVCSGLVLIAQLGMALSGWTASDGAQSLRAVPIAEGVQNTRGLGMVLYDRYALMFQLAGLILLVSMIGAILLTMRHRKDVKRQNVLEQMWRDPAKQLSLKDVKPGQGL